MVKVLGTQRDSAEVMLGVRNRLPVRTYPSALLSACAFMTRAACPSTESAPIHRLGRPKDLGHENRNSDRCAGSDST